VWIHKLYLEDLKKKNSHDQTNLEIKRVNDSATNYKGMIQERKKQKS